MIWLEKVYISMSSKISFVYNVLWLTNWLSVLFFRNPLYWKNVIEVRILVEEKFCATKVKMYWEQWMSIEIWLYAPSTQKDVVDFMQTFEWLIWKFYGKEDWLILWRISPDHCCFRAWFLQSLRYYAELRCL